MWKIEDQSPEIKKENARYAKKIKHNINGIE